MLFNQVLLDLRPPLLPKLQQYLPLLFIQLKFIAFNCRLFLFTYKFP